ncbi:T3SS (YopN, CesT) and YbjN peptide-binding chaperone 1 [Microlunatus speluncae]|uniref:T3SS (YopN, CesT) and YbjN peptide-binding chaperone 1 n=1 Tax=Microlunatus speluncae TaxID=2594267 RepID=UPI0012664C51|nr:YbjN domain-containing protein [Microlunatus speluncae]
MPDYEDFDIDRSTAQAWAEFTDRLAEVVSMIDESGDLTIGTVADSGGPAPFVSFNSASAESEERRQIRSEAASNANLGEKFQLSADQLKLMEDLGWESPTAEPDGSSNFWTTRSQEESDDISRLAVGALRDVYGVLHPVFLAPSQLAEVLQPRPTGADTADLPESVVALLPGSKEHLDELIDAELTDLLGHPPIRDSEGDVAIRVGSTMVFLRSAADGREIIVFSTVVHEVDGRSRASEVLNDLNSEARWVKFQLIRDRVFVSMSIPARPFVPSHLRQAVRIMSDVADGIDDELANRLRGRTTFGEHDDPR